MIPLPRFDRQGVLSLVLFCHGIAFAMFLSLWLVSLPKNIDRCSVPFDLVSQRLLYVLRMNAQAVHHSNIIFRCPCIHTSMDVILFSLAV